MDDSAIDTIAPAATLEMTDVRLSMADLHSGELTLDLSLAAGELAVVSLDDVQQALMIADTVCGLHQPRHGSVHFQGQVWTDSPPDYANARRGRIGCMLDDTAWLPYVTLTDNILLPMLYHTRQPRDEVLREAARLARQLGFIGLPMGYPDDYGEGELRRAAFVRAFLGRPDLVLIRSQPADFAPDRLGLLLNTVRQARDGGTAILWFVPNGAFDSQAAPSDCRRYVIADNRLVEDTGL
jgi:phospholipid/cholesterol/gamma-HCH transport system ATP-binding protein